MDFRDLPSLAAALLALDARGVGGICLRGPSGPARDGWLDFLRSLLPPDTLMRKLPMGVTADRLLGGPDLAATLAQGRRVVRGGVVHETDRGILLVPSLERVTLEVASALLGALDHGQVHLEREGCSAILPASVAVVGMDESRDDAEGPPRALLERIGIQMDLPPPMDRTGAGRLGVGRLAREKQTACGTWTELSRRRGGPDRPGTEQSGAGHRLAPAPPAHLPGDPPRECPHGRRRRRPDARRSLVPPARRALPGRSPHPPSPSRPDPRGRHGSAGGVRGAAPTGSRRGPARAPGGARRPGEGPRATTRGPDPPGGAGPFHR